MSKVICSEAIARVADRSMQILGGLGMTRDTVVERIFRDTRAFRIYDGPSEVPSLGARRAHRFREDVVRRGVAFDSAGCRLPAPL
jgi:alkylation response protein AidB-like acyl-CoA dehydrogenase